MNFYNPITYIPNFQTKPSFEDYYASLPPEKSNTNDFDLITAYNYLPYRTMERFRDDPDFHLPSVAPISLTRPPEAYFFLKSKNHPTYEKELAWYYGNSPDAVQFRHNYDLFDEPEYPRYIEKLPTLNPLAIGKNIGETLSADGGLVERVWNHFHPETK